jgi:SAM-dependent methyltransferase
MTERFTDRTVLTTEAYADPTRLVTRYSLYRYRRPQFDLPAATAELMHDVPGPIVDVGCGPGRHVAALRTDRPQRTVVAMDLSPGMARVAGAPAAVADITALPLADASCGGLLAMHMLYHVPDPEAGVRELARAKAPGGTVLIATNAEDDKEALYTVCRAAAADVPEAADWRRVSRRFELARAEDVAGRYFASVRRLDYTGDIVIADPEPVVAFVESLGAWAPQAHLPAVLDGVRRRVGQKIEEDGEFHLKTHIGILVCR